MEVTSTLRHASGGPGPEPEHANVYEAFLATVSSRGAVVAIRNGANDETTTWDELEAWSRRVAGGLNSLGVNHGDTVAMMLTNRPEFFACDLAVISLGGVPFSIYQTSSPGQIAYMVGDAGAKVAIVETKFLEAFEKAREDLPLVENVIVLDGPGGTISLEDLEKVDPDFDTATSAGNVGLDDLLTLIYTSGTTGPPKGVELTHGNLLSVTASVEDFIEFPEVGGKVISWLPSAHIAERSAHYYLPVTRGLEITTCPDARKIIEFLPKVKPTWFFAVPRIYEKLKAGLEAQLASLPEEQRVQAMAGLEASLQKVRLEQAGKEVPADIAAIAAAADEQLFSSIRTHLGFDELVALNVAAAPTPIEVLEFFHALGIEVGELWGLSETCGIITCNPPDRIKLGTVGPPIAGCEVKIADDGEILCRGISIMPGYHNQPEKTAETFVDGWLATGDIGELDEDGYLTIVDRKKELIINAAGKNMSPANIESHMKAASPLIGQVVAIGDRRPYNVAIVVLDPDYAPVWAAQNGLEGLSLAELAGEAKLRSAIQSGIEEANGKMARVEQIKKFEILPTEWLPGGDELTPTMKLKRKPITEKYESVIDDLYARDDRKG